MNRYVHQLTAEGGKYFQIRSGGTAATAFCKLYGGRVVPAATVRRAKVRPIPMIGNAREGFVRAD